MKRDVYENIVRSMRAADTLHHKAAAELERFGSRPQGTESGEMVAGALLALDRRIACLIFGWMEDTRDRLEEDEAEAATMEEDENETD